MAFKKTQVPYVKTLPGRQSLTRALLLLLMTAALALLIMGKTGNPWAERLRVSITDTLLPVLEVAAAPMDSIADAGAWLTEMARLHAENVALKNQNLQLLKWQAVAKDMETENQSLRGLLNVVPSQKHSYVTARIVSDLGGPYVHSALINGGSDNGIKKDQAVMNESGLVGRVIEVGKTSSRILLLGDINSRVPVVAANAHEKSILSGNNDGLLTLSYLAAGSRIAVGERIVTSGDGGVFPAGIPVGVVVEIDEGTVKVQPFADPAKVEYISTVDYSF